MKKILPAEWNKQQFVQLTWPFAGTDWNYMLDEVIPCYTEIVRNLLPFVRVLIVCHAADEVKMHLHNIDHTQITFVELPYNDTWARDHGGITVFEDNRPVIYDFQFNGWGKKFEASLDNQLTRNLYEQGVFGTETGYRNCLDFVLEGGSIESDGQGTLLTTSACLLSPHRNNLSKEQIEEQLMEYFGLQRVLWLNHGYLSGDDTDSHIDTLARFCNPDTIAYVKCDDVSDEHCVELTRMEEELKQFRTLEGKPYTLVPLPMADAVYEAGERLPATYANFLISNQIVLVPTYGTAKDEIALRQLQAVFPSYRVIGINCLPLIRQHGSLHCITMQYC